jgi:hypothetical protein
VFGHGRGAPRLFEQVGQERHGVEGPRLVHRGRERDCVRGPPGGVGLDRSERVPQNLPDEGRLPGVFRVTPLAFPKGPSSRPAASATAWATRHKAASAAFSGVFPDTRPSTSPRDKPRARARPCNRASSPSSARPSA